MKTVRRLSRESLKPNRILLPLLFTERSLRKSRPLELLQKGLSEIVRKLEARDKEILVASFTGDL